MCVSQQRLLSLPTTSLEGKTKPNQLTQMSAVHIAITPAPPTPPADDSDKRTEPEPGKPQTSTLLPFRVKFVFDNPLEVKLRPVVKRRQSSASCYSTTHQQMALANQKQLQKVEFDDHFEQYAISLLFFHCSVVYSAIISLSSE